jgi:DNA-binding IclR family transcriptional regulator
VLEIVGANVGSWHSEQRGKILMALEESTEPMKPQEIADETGMKPVNVRRMLSKMAKNGEVEKANIGLYQLPP